LVLVLVLVLVKEQTPPPPLLELLVAREMARGTWHWEGCSSMNPNAKAKGSVSKQYGSTSSSYRQVPHLSLHPQRKW